MGGTQRQTMYAVAFLAFVGLTIVSGRPAEEPQVLDKESAAVTALSEQPSASVVQGDSAKTPTEAKQQVPVPALAPAPLVDEATLLAALPTSLTPEPASAAGLQPGESAEPVTFVERDVAVVIADLPLPEGMVVVSDESRGRLLRRLPRAHLRAEARDADGSDGSSLNSFGTFYKTDATDDSSSVVFGDVQHGRTSAELSSSKLPPVPLTELPGGPPARLPAESPKRASFSTQAPTFPPVRLEDLVMFAGSEEEGESQKKMRKHRILFPSDRPTITSKLDERGMGEVMEARSDSRKLVLPGSFHNIQDSPTSHTYEVTEAGKETIIFMKPKPIQSDPLERQPKQTKLQLIRHIHHQQFAVPFTDPSQSYLAYLTKSTGVPFAMNGPRGAPVRPVVPLPVAPVANNQPSIVVSPQTFGAPPAHKKTDTVEGSDKPTDSSTSYLPFLINDQTPSLYNTGFTQSITNIFEYGEVPSSCAHPEKQTRSVRQTRAIDAPYETYETSPSNEEPTTEIPDGTTLVPEVRELGSLTGPVLHTITRDDDEEKVRTTIVLHGGGEPDDEDDDEEDDDDEPALPASALDDTEDEEIGPSPSNKGDFQKKLKDKLDKIEQKIRKRIKTSQNNLHGLRKQVNRHVTEVVMHSQGGLEEAGPIVSKLVVRRGGVAIAGPGGIATAGFGGTAIVGPGGTAYTSPDSLAVAGPGARVISVPSSKLQEMFDSFRKASGRNIEAFKPSWLGTIPPDGKLVATGPVVFFNPPEQAAPGFSIALELQEKAGVHQDRVIADAPADLSRTAAEGFTPYIEPSSGGHMEPVIAEHLGGRPAFIPVIDSGRLEAVAEGQIKETPSALFPAPAAAPTTPPAPPSARARGEMIAGIKEQIKAEIAGTPQHQPLQLIDIKAPVEFIELGVSDQEKAVEAALRPYKELLSRVQETSAVDLVVGDIRGNGEAPTKLLLRPMAKAVAGKGGIAVAAPLSRAVVRGEQPVRVRYQPNIVAVAGPRGMAHALGELLLQYADRP